MQDSNMRDVLSVRTCIYGYEWCAM